MPGRDITRKASCQSTLLLRARRSAQSTQPLQVSQSVCMVGCSLFMRNSKNPGGSSSHWDLRKIIEIPMELRSS